MSTVNIDAKFDKAVQIVGELPAEGPIKPTQDQKLLFYAHFKQATEGDVSGPAPGFMDFVGKAKYKARQAITGMSKQEAKQKYVELLEEMLNKAGDEDAKKYLAELETAGSAPAVAA
ncbi:hypothetical protein TREMEDRAFT_41825 [Tremella mesenterica DSM 1558]|uniref:uncharacterized protein n=1 Tax=Tremella mesenterica (strain ATCC 24925 / CBS 8224 / DSM 1558 / NBRC 9311 / NRRL Y-6157 / RJB 2259-6 / UBC 559-6) TaxID=578456 RepID=UPI0003F49235|nr:uncharacterized protein TREMEDRAFT_41825 [Tremella mesenterica DSM 1558]EIW72552.1 hypothetical protein TREMEDRAFT_41825 [Tremella mesenterica DSM 1558]